MNVAAMLQQMRDPMGVPFYPWFFQGLMVFFFTLHIFMINIVMGSVAVALWGRWKGGEFPNRLSAALARAATVHLSLAVLLGIAPLLFVQVIYDPFWYSSTLLSAGWAMLFVLAAMSGFLALYAFYLRGRKRCGAGGGFGLFAFCCVVFAGMVMHLLSMQALAPERWAQWAAPAGKMVTSGWGFHAFSPGRFLHFVAPAFLNAGIFMMLHAWYLSPRPDADPAYLQWTASAGVRMAGYASLAEAATGGWFLMEVPEGFGFAFDPFLLAGSVMGLALIVLLFAARKNPIRYALPAAALALATTLVMAAARETLRMDHLGRFGYSVYDYPMHLDWGSTTFFLGTLAMGLVVTAYPVAIAFKAGREGVPRREEG